MCFEIFDNNFILGVTIEKGLHWLPKATIATRLQNSQEFRSGGDSVSPHVKIASVQA